MRALVKQFQPLVEGESKVAVSLQGDFLEIKLATWTDGLGWCDQKTIRVPQSMLNDLHHLLSAARISRNRDMEFNDQTSTVIDFPM
jgi:hypothetical protein